MNGNRTKLLKTISTSITKIKLIASSFTEDIDDLNNGKEKEAIKRIVKQHAYSQARL